MSVGACAIGKTCAAADTYIALFSHFIPCGVWEAIYILEGLLKSTSEVRPTIVHGATQAESTTVFGLPLSLGIKLMPAYPQLE